MDIGVVTVRDGNYHPNRRLLEAAGKSGCRLGLVNPYRLGPRVDHGRLFMDGMESSGMPRVILPRQGAQIGESSLGVLSQFAAMGVPLVNDVPGIRIARNKFLTLQTLAGAGLPVPETVFANSREVFFGGIERLGGLPLVTKKLSSRQGGEVFLLEDARDGERVLAQHLDPAQGLILQRFIPPEDREDLRVLVIGGNIAAAVAFSPNPGDFRANFHLGGSSRAVSISDDLAELAAASARSVGLDIAGVDLIIDLQGRPWVIEVNYSPGFRGVEAATGRDIAAEIVEFALSFI